MPRFFFHVMDGRALVDNEGTDLEDVAAARREAIRTAGAILAEEETLLLHAKPWRMTVADSSGKTVFSLLFEATDH